MRARRTAWATCSPTASPGARLLLRPDPGNKYDKYAVSVWDGAGRVQAGFVPKEHSRDVTERLRHETLEAISLWEWRDERGERCGLRMLVCPPGVVAERPPPLTS